VSSFRTVNETDEGRLCRVKMSPDSKWDAGWRVVKIVQGEAIVKLAHASYSCRQLPLARCEVAI
jgi:hypothetical protein